MDCKGASISEFLFFQCERRIHTPEEVVSSLAFHSESENSYYVRDFVLVLMLSNYFWRWSGV